MPLSALRPSEVKSWCAKLTKDGHEPSYVYALHRRLSQILEDAANDGFLARNPCSRRTSPPMGKQKIYLATTEQIWAIYDAMPMHLQSAILLGAFAGLRIAEVSALKVDDVDFMRGVVHPRKQWPDKPLKSAGSEAEIPIPRELTLMLAATVKSHGGDYVVMNTDGERVGPWLVDRALRAIRGNVKDIAGRIQLPRLEALFRFAADCQGRRREDRASAATACFRFDDAQHLRPLVARRRRVHPPRNRFSDRGANGLA